MPKPVWLRLSVVVALLMLGVVASAADPIRLVWTGEQLPLPQGYFRHKDGHAFHMAPTTYVFALGREMPPGRYVVWLNPYYHNRQPVSFRLDGDFHKMSDRYFHGGWYGGNTVEARKPFSTITLDFSGVKNGIVGIAISSNPDDGFLRGRILPSEKAKAQGSAGARNLFRGSSFETGAGFGYTTNVRPEDFIEGGFHGRHALRVASLETRWFQLTPALPHVFSVYVKADQPMTLELTAASPADNQGKRKTHSNRVEVGRAGTWERVSLRFTPEAALGNLYQVLVTPRDRAAARPFLVDAAQLEQSDQLQPYQPAAAVEAGFRSLALGNTFIQGGPERLEVHLYNNGPAAAELAVTQVTFDFDGQQTARDEARFRVEPGHQARPAPRLSQRTGLFRTVLLDGEGRTLDELAYSVLPARPFAPDVRYPDDSTLGTDSSPAFLPFLVRANRHWLNSKHIGMWMFPSHYRIVFGKTAEDWTRLTRWFELAKESPARVFCNLCSHGSPLLEQYASFDAFVAAYAHWTGRVAAEYAKSGIEHFEVWNEPYYNFSPEQYLQLLKAAHAAIKAGNPKAKVVGICGQETWTRKLLDLGAAAYCDIVSNHYYDNPREAIKTYGELVKKHGLVAWNTETTGRCFSSYRSIPTVESVFAEDVDAHFEEIWRQQVIPAALDRLKNYLYCVTIGRCARYFTYVSRYNGTLADLHSTSSFTNTEWDGGMKATGVIQNIASFFVDGHRFEDELPFHPEIESLRMLSPRGENLLLLWLRGKGACDLDLPPDLSANARFHEAMGNEFTPPRTLRLDARPVYVRSALPPGRFAELVKGITARKADGPAQRAACRVERETPAMADAKAGAIALVPDRTRVTCEGFRKGMGNHFFRPGVTDMNAWLRLTHDGVSLIARCRVEDDAVLPSPNLGDGLKATGDHVRLSFRGKDAGTRMVLVGPTPAGCQAALIADGKAKPLRVTGKPFPGGYEAEVRFALADAGLAPGATALFDVAVCDADSRADDVDSEFVWSGAAHDPLDAGGYGEITLSP